MCLDSLTSFTSFDVFSNIVLNSRPPIIVCNEFCSFVTTGMSSKCGIVIFTGNVFSKFGMNWNVNGFTESDKPTL